MESVEFRQSSGEDWKGLDMKLLFVVLFCAVLGVISGAVENSDCTPMRRHEEYDWSTEADIYVYEQQNRTTDLKVISKYDHNQLSNLVNESQDGIFVIELQKSMAQRGGNYCLKQYFEYVLKTLLEYPQVKVVRAFCPSPACAELNVTSPISFDYYFKGQHKGQLVQGLDANEYLQKVKEAFGEPKKEVHDSYSCIPMKSYEEYNWEDPEDYIAYSGYEGKLNELLLKEMKVSNLFILSFRKLLENVDELSAAVNAPQDNVIIFVSYAALGKRESKDCIEKYKSYLITMFTYYPNVKFYQSYCPSPVCEALNATSGISFDYYSKGQHKGHLAQGLDASEYLQKAREVFGESRGCIAMKGYKAYDWPTEKSIPKSKSPKEELLQMDELSKFNATQEDAIVVATYGIDADEKLFTKGCMEKYRGYFLKIFQDYPQVKLYVAICPSAVCEALNVTSGSSLHYFSKGQHKGHLVQGLDASEYLQKIKEVFGEPAKN